MIVVSILCVIFIGGGIILVVNGVRETRAWPGAFNFLFGVACILVFLAYFILRLGQELGWWS